MPERIERAEYKIGDVTYQGENLGIFQSTYKGGRKAIYLMSGGMLFATLTVNLPDQPLEDGEFFVKDWSENMELTPWILENTELFEDTGVAVDTGFVRAPIWRFKKGVENARLK